VIADELIAAGKPMLAERRIAIVLVEQPADIAPELTSEAIVLERGAHSASLHKDHTTLERLFGLRVSASA
jgi:ABC-type branched-subunit amino acid transport system ATPase component